MKNFLSILMLFVVSFSFTACSVDDNNTNFKYVNLKVISADVPESFKFGGEYDIVVKYINPGSCTYFEGFDIHKHETTTREVYPIGVELIEENNCKEIATEVDKTFRFKVIYKDDYLFQFWTGKDADGKDTYLEISVPVK